MKLSFHGAAGTVTGSKYLVEHQGQRLLVDCGLFQGYKQLRLLNWEPLPFSAADIDAVVLTHSHLDHAGALPLLVKQGFRGRILATPSTIELCGLLLPDSGRIQEEDAAYANRHHTSKHATALPLYTEDDARRAMEQLHRLPFDQCVDVVPDVTVTLRPAGHILGAASAELTAGQTTVLFSGDVGRPDDPVMRAPAPAPKADYIVVESTYGDRLHEPVPNAQAVLGEAIARTAHRGGMVVIPAFAVGRAQLLLHLIHKLKQQGAIPDLPVFLDSPMAIDATEIYHRHHAEHKLSLEDCLGMYKAARMIRTPEESRALAGLALPAVIISASGMATGGRVLHHLALHAGHHRNLILLTGYQTPGTRGARLAAGEKTLRMLGQEVSIRAQVEQLQSASAHADAEQLLAWLQQVQPAPARVFVTHGDMGASDALRQRIEHGLRWRAQVPRAGASYTV